MFGSKKTDLSPHCHHWMACFLSSYDVVFSSNHQISGGIAVHIRASNIKQNPIFVDMNASGGLTFKFKMCVHVGGSFEQHGGLSNTDSGRMDWFHLQIFEWHHWHHYVCLPFRKKQYVDNCYLFAILRNEWCWYRKIPEGDGAPNLTWPILVSLEKWKKTFAFCQIIAKYQGLEFQSITSARKQTVQKSISLLTLDHWSATRKFAT